MNMRTLDDLNKDKKNEKKDAKDKKNNNMYAGGQASGLAIENPDDKKNIEDILQGSQDRQGGEPPKTNCKITLFSNGFQINDEEFRDYSEPQNKQFIAELKQGHVPKELRAKFPEGLYVGLDDKTSVTFTPPPPPSYISFSGQGVSLGGPQQLQQQPQKIEIQKQASGGSTFQHNPNKPTTSIVVRLHDGQTINLTVNHDTKVNQIFEHIKKIVNPGQRQIQIIAGYPPKPLTNLELTVEDADLMDSEIRQTLS